MASGKIRIDGAGLDKVRQRMAELEKPLNPDKRGWSQENLEEQAHVSVSTIKRFFQGTPRDRSKVILILQALGFEPIKFIAEHDSNLQNSELEPQPNIAIDWQRVCQEMLNEQQEEQRFRRRATEMGFEVNVFVPLGLIERKQQQRRSGNVPMELLHQLEPEVVTRIYEHDEFMTDVIGQNPTGKNKHIAIVGEPGAGKTTLLDKIATHIQENNRDLPICIALASLQGKTLKEYIIQEWLPEAISLVYPDIDVEKFHEKSLQKRLRQGGVWLLLDGVDEMAVGANSSLSLEEIQNQLTDWLGNMRVVLTCRTNVWDARVKNPLTGFDTYKTQEFKLEQVDNFIQQWFAEAKNIQRGQELQKKLQEPQKERIRQLVKNPLRLSLLCQISSQNKQAELPETKAELYQHFVRYFYEWKPSQTVIDWATQPSLQEKLHQALGRLSIAGLDSDNRFRLPLSLIKEEMDDRLFKLACALGWLNLVDWEATKHEPVYAFFHPTFQEYFASLVIDNQFFMERYRIFETQWLEVAILWLENPKASATQKEQLLTNRMNFNQDGSQVIYQFKTLPLDIVYYRQFREDELKIVLLELIFMLVRHYYLDEATQLCKLIPFCFDELIIDTLKYYALQETCDLIIKDIKNNSALKPHEISGLLKLLFKINPHYKYLKVLVIDVLKRYNDEVAIEIAITVLKNDSFQQIAVEFLVNFLLSENEQDEYKYLAIVDALIMLNVFDKVVINKLISFLDSHNSVIKFLSLLHLEELSLNHNNTVNNQQVLDALIQCVTQNIYDDSILHIIINIFQKVDIDISRATHLIIDLLYISQNSVTIIVSLQYLQQRGLNVEIFNELINLILIKTDEFDRFLIAQTLKQEILKTPNLLLENNSIVQELIQLIDFGNDFWHIAIEICAKNAAISETFKTLLPRDKKWNCFIDAINTFIPIDNKNINEQLISNESNNKTEEYEYLETLVKREYVEREYREYLEFISIINYPEKLNHKTWSDNNFNVMLSHILMKLIANSRPINIIEVMDKLIEVIKNNSDNELKFKCIHAISSMGKFLNKSIIEKMVNLLFNSNDNQLQTYIEGGLKQINEKAPLQMLVVVINNYLQYANANLEDNYNKWDYYKLEVIAYSVLWHCANHLSYKEFYDACCVQPSCTDLEAFENISVANSSTPQLLNKVEQSSVLQSAVSHNEELNRAVQLICIDGSEFNPLDNPATDIYIQMVEQGCPERQEGTPTTMPLLKAYWRLNLRNLEKRVALVFYNSKIDREFSEPFLTALSAFGGTIAIITDRPCDNVKRISPNHPNLIDAVLKWLNRSILEA